MPSGAAFNSFIRPYRIRVDDFTESATLDCKAGLHLLTHTHTDHITGLAAKSFASVVVCSPDSKQMLLCHEVYMERALLNLELRAKRTRTYAHLKVDACRMPDGSIDARGSRDLLRVIDKHTPTEFIISEDEKVLITAFDANHCPGAYMYLVEGKHGAVLHTGDFRAEPWFLDSLVNNPLLQPYLASNVGRPNTKTLHAIYLDTASALSTVVLPTKRDATRGLVELMKLFSKDVYFFLNTWTWGYEDILLAVSDAFKTKVHVDRYKHSIYSKLEDQTLNNCTTRDPASSRFHACERFERCEYVDVEGSDLQEHSDQSRSRNGKARFNTTSRMGKRVVYVNPVSMGVGAWALYLKETKAKLSSGEKVHNLIVPLLRHSSLPELQSFVSLFRPRTVIPNSLVPGLHGLDRICIERMFSGCVLRTPNHTDDTEDLTLAVEALAQEDYDDRDVALKNLVGVGANDVAERWADNGFLRKKVSIVRQYLTPTEKITVDRVLGMDEDDMEDDVTITPKRRAIYNLRDSDEDSDRESDDGRTANILFGKPEWNLPLSSSPQSMIAHCDSLSKRHRPPISSGQAKKQAFGPPTPVSSPAQPNKRKRKNTQLELDQSPPSSPPRTKRHKHHEFKAFQSPRTYTRDSGLRPPLPSIAESFGKPRGIAVNRPVNAVASGSQHRKELSMTASQREGENYLVAEQEAAQRMAESDPDESRWLSAHRSFEAHDVSNSMSDRGATALESIIISSSSSPDNSPSRRKKTIVNSTPNPKEASGSSRTRASSLKRVQRAQRFHIAQNIANARPDLVSPEFREAVAARRKRKTGISTQASSSPITSNSGNVLTLNETSNAEGRFQPANAKLQEQNKMGLPLLSCADSQCSEDT